jgi:Mg2+-importing ATPase
MGAYKKNSDVNDAFWSLSIEQQFKQLNTSPQGLKSLDAEQRIKRYGFNQLNHKNEAGNIHLFFSPFKSSIILILLFTTGLSFFLNDRINAAIISTIVLISGCLGFWLKAGNVMPGDCLLINSNNIFIDEGTLTLADNKPGLKIIVSIPTRTSHLIT